MTDAWQDDVDWNRPFVPGAVKLPAMSLELTAALERAQQWMATATDAEKEAMWIAQRRSWTKGPHGPTDGMGTAYHYAPAPHQEEAGE